MIPLKIRLRNFMCYRDPSPLDLTGIHLACLAGDNGHGKSALLDAMTWALWGKARARSDDELVTLGQKDMEVEFEFLLGSMHYRVLRKRQLGRTSKSALEFQAKEAAATSGESTVAMATASCVSGGTAPHPQVGGDGEFRPFTGATQRETQARINQVLRMDYDTFVNSALLLQGRADEFTIKTPAERKGILAEILGLSIYDDYEQRAKELAKEKEQAEREVGARIQEIERELEHRAEYETELAATQAELARLAREVKVTETALQELRDQVKTLEAQRVQLADVNKRMQASESQLQELDSQVELLDQKVAAYQAILERRDAIETGYEQLLHAREQEAEYSAKVAQLLTLSAEQTAYEKQVAEAQQSLELEKHVVEAQISELEKVTKQRPAWEADLNEVTKELEELAALQTRAEEGKERIRGLSNEASGLNAGNAQLKVEMAALKDKLGMLSVPPPASSAGQAPTAACPLCGQSLSEEDRQRLLAEFESTGAEQADLYRRNASRLKEIDSKIGSTETEVERITRDLRRLPAVQGRFATLSKSLEDARQASDALEDQQQILLTLQRQLEQRDFAATAQRQLAAVQKRVAALGYDRAAHDEIRKTLVKLASLEADHAELDKAQQAITQLRENKEQLAQARAHLAKGLESDRQRQAELAQALTGAEELARNLEAKTHQADELRSQEGHARQVVGASQQKLDYCRYLAKEQQERSKQLHDLAEERGLYEELQLAFGKKGLQALIIEAAIPELEEEANALLARMTEGRMNLHFDTQRDTKAGNVIETLDIKIADENGLRSYEMYSGGEAFRINFAIRIALSKLLARRAGAQLQTLIIDEGFGTQDADGRQKLVEAINSIKDDFARILVITHIAELQDAFPVRIDVYKTAHGSQIRVA
jgi:exonuclease SbcC